MIHTCTKIHRSNSKLAISYRCETKDNYRLCAGNTMSRTTNYLNRCFVSYTWRDSFECIGNHLPFPALANLQSIFLGRQKSFLQLDENLGEFLYRLISEDMYAISLFVRFLSSAEYTKISCSLLFRRFRKIVKSGY